MERDKRRSYLIGIVSGFLLGFFIIHPFSMVFQGLVHPFGSLQLNRLADAFSPHHLPMAIFFGLLGTAVACLIVFFLTSLMKEKERVKILEGLLPICSYCKQIRDDADNEPGQGNWMNVEQYLSQKTDADFTHGVCPKCYKKMMEEINKITKGNSSDKIN